jgi:hypothetical protein
MPMKPFLTLSSSTHLQRLEDDITGQIKRLFERFPNLAGFSLVDRSALPDDIDPSGREGQLFISDIGFCPPVSQGEHGRACNRICDVLTDIVREQPEAFELLNGASYSRTLH